MKLAATGARLTIPQSRIGRRSISVANFLKKDQAGQLFKRAEDLVVEPSPERPATPQSRLGDGPTHERSTANPRTTGSNDARQALVIEGTGAMGIGPVKMGTAMDYSKLASFFYSSFFAELEHELQKEAEAAVTPEAAQDSLRHLQELNRTRPSGDQLQRGAAVGALVGPVAASMSKTIAGTWKPSAVGNLRELAASSASGAVFGGLMPAVRHKLESRAETGKLEQFNAQPGVRHLRIPT